MNKNMKNKIKRMLQPQSKKGNEMNLMRKKDEMDKKYVLNQP